MPDEFEMMAFEMLDDGELRYNPDLIRWCQPPELERDEEFLKWSNSPEVVAILHEASEWIEAHPNDYA